MHSHKERGGGRRREEKEKEDKKWGPALHLHTFSGVL